MIWLHNAASQAVCSALTWTSSAAGNPVSDYWRRNTDAQLNPFRGLYQLNTFDFAIMLPYFFVMSILAMYGIHRYALVYNYCKNRQHLAVGLRKSPSGPASPCSFRFTERYVIERLVEAVAAFDYPRELLIFRCSTIPPTKRKKSRAIASSAIRASVFRSAIFTATIAKDLKLARYRKD